MARKPIIGTVAANVQQFGMGALNIDDCRVGVEERTYRAAERSRTSSTRMVMEIPESDTWTVVESILEFTATGRWPANLIHDGSEEVLAAFPQAPGQIADASSSSSRKTQNVYGDMKRGNGRDNEVSSDSENEGEVGFKMKPGARRLDSGSAARFFYCAKASKDDREEGLEWLDPKRSADRVKADGVGGDNPRNRSNRSNRNHHPTVKPTDLMRYLCRLVTPKGGTVLDPFMGSGSTGRGAIREGFGFIGIEIDPEYCEIARLRIHADAPMFAEVAA